MSKIKILLLLFVAALMLSGCTENLAVQNENAAAGSIGYVFVKKTVLGVDQSSKQANKYSNEYVVSYLNSDEETTIYTSESTEESAMVLEDSLRISSKDKADSTLESIVDVSFTGSVAHESTEAAYDMEITSSDGQITAYSVLEKAAGSAMPTAMVFRELVVEGDTTTKYQAQDFSSLPALYPIAFSQDNSQLLIRASQVREQDYTDPREYFLITIGNGFEELISSPLSEDSSAGITLSDFVSDELIVGTKTKDTKDGPTNSLVIYDLSKNALTVTDVALNNIVDVIGDYPAEVVYFDIYGALQKYSADSDTTEMLKQDWVSMTSSQVWMADDGEFFVYSLPQEKQATESRGDNLVNGADTKEQVSEYYVYDVEKEVEELVLTDSRHLGGDEVGDVHYDFLGLVE